MMGAYRGHDLEGEHLDCEHSEGKRSESERHDDRVVPTCFFTRQ